MKFFINLWPQDNFLFCTFDYVGFNLLNYTDPNSATSLYGRMYMPLLSTLMTMAFIATFGV